MHPFALKSQAHLHDPSAACNAAARIPMAVVVCLLVDLTLAALHVAVELAIRFGWVGDTDLFHLGREQNIPTWYSSTKLAAVGLTLFCTGFLLRGVPRLDRMAVLLGAAMFTVLSIDETAMLHERAGDLINTDSIRSRFVESGIWPILCAPLFLVAIFVVYRMGRRLLSRNVIALLATGLAILLGGAVGLEMAANLVTPYSLAYHGLVLCEETLEMMGASVLLWGAICFAQSHGVRLSAARPGESATA